MAILLLMSAQPLNYVTTKWSSSSKHDVYLFLLAKLSHILNKLHDFYIPRRSLQYDSTE